MTIQHARLRALHVTALAGLCLLAFGGQARADDGTVAPPRAVPLARALPRSFASYDALIATAGAVANDQLALNAQLAAARLEHDLARSILATLADPRQRGGLIRTEMDVTDKPSIAALRAQLVSTAAAETRLIASGAMAIPPVSTWLRPLAGETTQPFGPTSLRLEPARRYQGVYYWNFHDGVDIRARAGTPIFAPARGRVVFAGRMGDGAEVVVLAHDNGLVSLYAHLQNGPQAPTVRSGDIVEAGDRLGLVGLTGLTTGYHLHWAVYKNGEPIDPFDTLGD